MRDNRIEGKAIATRCITTNRILNTVKKSIINDSKDIDGFSDHYSNLIDIALEKNLENNIAAEKITRDSYWLNTPVE